jgi:hypothetical protein
MAVETVSANILIGIKRCVPMDPGGRKVPQNVRQQLYFLGLLAFGHRLVEEGRQNHPLLSAFRVPVIETIVDGVMLSRPPGCRIAIRAEVFRRSAEATTPETTRRLLTQIGRFAVPLFYARDLARLGGQTPTNIAAGVETGIRVLGKITSTKVPRAVKATIMREESTQVRGKKEHAHRKVRQSEEPLPPLQPREVFRTIVDGQLVETISDEHKAVNSAEATVLAMDGRLNIIPRATANDLKDQYKHRRIIEKFEISFAEKSEEGQPFRELAETQPEMKSADDAERRAPQAILADLLADPRFQKLLAATETGATTQLEMARHWEVSERTIRNWVKALETKYREVVEDLE